MLYREELATRGAAAFSRMAAHAPRLSYQTQMPGARKGIPAATDHRPARDEGTCFPFDPAASEGAQSSDMFTVQPAGSRREKSRLSRTKNEA
ncbi:MAG: hypothetical protein ACT6QT_18125 [Sphingopyxis sp.]|jgi:hypothetical protein|uniref:hypothetical protein n=1 Tax=unclassified Sphingopyxis TaxID=2614943 RepID=UPI000A9DC6BD|nr:MULTISPECIES: hypothetical protein [unclassified Sphingopyxis]MDR7061299.1 hypothetical protein [Sphingopyxis sp. BE235]MDR7181970.1 hypothetical protein [Sphingopyxis sp. BE249]